MTSSLDDLKRYWDIPAEDQNGSQNTHERHRPRDTSAVRSTNDEDKQDFQPREDEPQCNCNQDGSPFAPFTISTHLSLALPKPSSSSTRRRQQLSRCICSITKGRETNESHLLAISQTLPPTSKTQAAETLRLDLDRDIEVLHHRIHAKGHAADGPEEHHQRWQAFGALGAVVAPYLRCELDAPKSVGID